MPAAPRPFPWGSVESTTRAEVARSRDARRWVASFVDVGRLNEAAGHLLGAPLEVRVRRVQPAAASRAIDGGLAVVLSIEPGAGPERELRLEAEAALVAAAVARAVRRPGPRWIAAASGAPELAGAFAAVVAAVARRAHAGVALRVVSAGLVPPRLEGGADDVDDARLALSLTVVLDDEAYAARLVFPALDAARTAGPAWTRDALAGLGAVRLPLPLVAWAYRMAAAEAAELRAGDVLLAPSPVSASGARYTGPLWLAAAHADWGVRAELVEGSRLVLRGGPDPLGGESMNDTDVGDALVSTLGDVPVVVRVEIGEAALSAREWASLARGDVIALGRKVGDRVVLRVGGVPVARGDLVEIDGEVGVRIGERLGDTEA